MSYDEFISNRERESVQLQKLYVKMKTEAREATTVRRANRLASKSANEPRSSDMIWILNQHHAEVENHVGLGQHDSEGLSAIGSHEDDEREESYLEDGCCNSEDVLLKPLVHPRSSFKARQ
jgi:hypothetical protein